MDNNIKMLIVSVVYLVLDITWIFLNIHEQNENILRIQVKHTEITYKLVIYN